MNATDLSRAEVLSALGITYRQLDHWCRRGYLRPIGEGEGSGSRRAYPPLEVSIGRRIVQLAADGLRLDVAAVRARAELAAQQ